LGNVTDPPTLEFLQKLSPDYQAVKGEFDLSPALPLNRVVTHGKLRIGFAAGYSIVPNSDPDSLLIAARQLDVDIFIWGGTHRCEAFQLEGKFFINPGTATGAFYHGWTEDDAAGNAGEDDDEDPQDPDPTFCLLDIQGSACVIYIYSLVNGEVKVDKVSYRKEASPAN
jgi:vacuolar protein sorting-associated protein 29